MAMTTAQKLRIKDGHSIRLLTTPADYESRLGELPDNVTFQTPGTGGTPDAIHWLVSTLDELAGRFPELEPELRSTERAWILYPRKKKYADGDANRDSIW